MLTDCLQKHCLQKHCLQTKSQKQKQMKDNNKLTLIKRIKKTVGIFNFAESKQQGKNVNKKFVNMLQITSKGLLTFQQ